MKDREDEEEIQQNFCFVLAEELERDGIISYHAKRLLDLGEYVLPLFSAADSSANCLMLHTVGQDHGVVQDPEEERNSEAADWNKAEPATKAVVNELAEEGEREVAGEEGKVNWRRQQATVIIYEGKSEGFMEETDFEEDKEITTVETEHHAPSKL